MWTQMVKFRSEYDVCGVACSVVFIVQIFMWVWTSGRTLTLFNM
jgi:hypothetical protein